MTQRVARPMKFAAFISIIVSVAVMFAACQGAVGPKGDKGDKGDDGAAGAPGAPGDQGPQGEPGYTPLQLKGMAPFVLISDNAGGAVGDPETIDLTNNFRSSQTVTAKAGTVTGDDFTATVDGLMLTLKAIADDGSDPYAVNTVPVTLTDEDGASVTLTVRARRNRGPTQPVATSDDQIVGTQAPEMAPEMVAACPLANECMVTLLFIDADSTTTDGEEKLVFTGTSADIAKAEVVEVKTGADGVTAQVVLRGIASTWVADTDTTNTDPNEPGHKRVKISVTAVDADGLPALVGGNSPTANNVGEGVINIAVDGAPVGSPIPDGSVSQANSTYVIANLRPFFEDPEGEVLEYSFKVADGKVASAAITDGSSSTPEKILTVSRIAQGSTMVTVTATEPDTADQPQQSVSVSFTVTATD